MRKLNEDAQSTRAAIPPEKWESFLEDFSRRHRGWLVRLQTHDLVTRERVTSADMTLLSIDLDLEDEKNPRINVIGQFDNKVSKHILFLPSRLVSEPPVEKKEHVLHVETVNTETTIRVRPPERHSSV
jgi:hypothetical protein